MKFLVAYGTRPERIKLAPVIDALRDRGAEVETWFSGQSPDLVEVESPRTWSFNNGLNYGIARVLARENKFEQYDAVIVQGDTATAFAVALAAYLSDTPVAHIEAGLRTYRKDPYPEEAFRGMIARLATWHFAPDEAARQNLINELWHSSEIHVVGNTVIDTLATDPFSVLVTLHRRENWGERIQNALTVLRQFDAFVSVIQHPNWKNFDYVTDGLHLCDPMSHEELQDLMLNSSIVVTDSGGLQEEAAHYGIPCLVLRESTERVALERCGAIKLVHPDRPTELRLALEAEYDKRHCYGDGTAGEKIADILCS